MGTSLSPQRVGDLFAVKLLNVNAHGNRNIAAANEEYSNKTRGENQPDGGNREN
ncbi:MAG: hypothetical protein ACI8RD_010660 [Bacillariaceae sp.]|jgi:hypothetical protein